MTEIDPTLHETGRLGDFIGRPLLSLDVPPSYNLTFANMTLGRPMDPMNFEGDSSLFTFEEEIDLPESPTLTYDRILHCWINDPQMPIKRFGPYYVPYIAEERPNSSSASSGGQIYVLKPLREVINPRIIKLSPNTFALFFFSNFSTDQLPDDEYTDDPEYLIRTIEFATNTPDLELGSSSSSSSGSTNIKEDNTYNYYPDGEKKFIGNPKVALMSCIMRIGVMEIDDVYEDETTSGSSSSSGSGRVKRLYPICEKPTIVEWLGHQFAQDAYPSFLVNRKQSVDWKPVEEVNTEKYLTIPSLEIPEHHLINGVQTTMYPGYTGFDFDTIPINEVFKDSLNYVLEIERIGEYDPHDPEYATYYNNFRPDATEIRFTKVEWKVVQAPSLTLTNRVWEHSPSSYASSEVVEYKYPYEGSKTNTHFVVFSIQYKVVIIPYDILHYISCPCNPSSSSSSSSSSSCEGTQVTLWYGYIYNPNSYPSAYGYDDLYCGDSWYDCFTDETSVELYSTDTGSTSCEDYVDPINGWTFSQGGIWYSFQQSTGLANPYVFVQCTTDCQGEPNPPDLSLLENGVEDIEGFHSDLCGFLWAGEYFIDCGEEAKISNLRYERCERIAMYECDSWFASPNPRILLDCALYIQTEDECEYLGITSYKYPFPPMECDCDLDECTCLEPSSSSSASPIPPTPSSSSSVPIPTPVPIEELFYSDLTTRGLISPNMGRPFEIIEPAVTYRLGFFNTTIYTPIEEMGFDTDTTNIIFNEDLDTYPNIGWDRVLHFWTLDAGNVAKRAGPYYVPYIESITSNETTTTYNFRPLREVINPRIQKLSEGLYVMYFFSNFTTDNLPNNEYTDNPKYLKRMMELATNDPQNIANKYPDTSSSTSLSSPQDNTRNWHADNAPEIDNPHCALCSCLIRIGAYEVNTPTNSSSSAKTKMVYPICEKPTIVNWVGNRFATDYAEPALVNRVQRIDWSTGKQDSDTLDENAVNDDPPRQMEYYDIIKSIEGKMYPGYMGLNLRTRPIIDIYPESLYHVFVIENNAGNDEYYLEVDMDEMFPYSPPINMSAWEWEHSAEPCTMNKPGLNVKDDPSENTPNAKTNTHYIVMRLRKSSSDSPLVNACSPVGVPTEEDVYLPKTRYVAIGSSSSSVSEYPSVIKYNGRCYYYEETIDRSVHPENLCWDQIEQEWYDPDDCEDCCYPGVSYVECGYTCFDCVSDCNPSQITVNISSITGSCGDGDCTDIAGTYILSKTSNCEWSDNLGVLNWTGSEITVWCNDGTWSVYLYLNYNFGECITEYRRDIASLSCSGDVVAGSISLANISLSNCSTSVTITVTS